MEIKINETMVSCIKANHFRDLEAFDSDTLIKARDTKHQNLLFYTVRQKAYDVLIYLIEIGLDVNLTNTYRETPLHIAAYLGDAFMVRLLLQRGAHIDACNKKNQTPLMLAALKGDFDTVKALVNQGATLSTTDAEDNHVLMFAVKSKKLKVVNYLIDAKAPMHQLNTKKESVMHIVAKYGLETILDRFIELGINAYQKNIYMQTPLHYAVTQQLEGIIDRLLACGLNSYDKDMYDESPYDKAQSLHYHYAINKFTRFKNDPEIQKNDHQYPLHRALRFNTLDEALAYMHKVPSVNQKDTFNNTPLFYALMMKDILMVESLLKRGAHQKNIDQTHKDALFYALIENDETLVDTLLKALKPVALSPETEKRIKAFEASPLAKKIIKYIRENKT